MKRIILSGGGTGGHIYPAVAVAEALKRRFGDGVEILFVGAEGKMEMEKVPALGYRIVGLPIAGLQRRLDWRNLAVPFKAVKSIRMAKRIIRDFGADAVVGFGGYVCIPVGRAAEKLGVPVVVHEQNSVMGMANKYLAKRAAAVCLTYEHAAGALDEGAHSRIAVTGNPVRKSVFDATREDGRARFGVPEDARLLLVTGGSLGARHLNQAVCALKDELLAAGDVHVVHVTGPKELDAVAGQLALTPAEEKRWHLFGYTDHMGEAMAAADAIVSRAGATSLAEISARAIPALLVPFPFATEDHQTTNARAYVEAGCAYMLADADVEGPEFARLVRSLLDDAAVRERMAAAARAQKTADAAAKLADVVMGAAR